MGRFPAARLFLTYYFVTNVGGTFPANVRKMHQCRGSAANNTRMTQERLDLYENQKNCLKLHSQAFIDKAVAFLESHGWVRYESEHNWVRAIHFNDPSVDLTKNDYFTMDAYAISIEEQETIKFHERWKHDGGDAPAFATISYGA